MDPDTLFVYGTLQFPEVLHALLGRAPDGTPATVAGWRVAALRGRVYPALVPAERVTTGRLLTGLTADEWRIIDAFEDEVYDLRRLTLTDARHGWAYVCRSEDDVLPDDWDSERFAAAELGSYVERCSAWRRRYHAEIE